MAGDIDRELDDPAGDGDCRGLDDGDGDGRGLGDADCLTAGSALSGLPSSLLADWSCNNKHVIICCSVCHIYDGCVISI